MSLERENAQRKGYVDRSFRESPFHALISELMRREQFAAQQQATTGRRPLHHKQGYFELTDGIERALPFKPKPVQQTLVAVDSRNFVVPGSNNVVRIFSKTLLGTAVIRELGDTALHLQPGAIPALTVAGVPVYVSVVKYAGDKWVTSAVASARDRLVHVEFEGRVDSAEKRARLASFMAPLVGA